VTKKQPQHFTHTKKTSLIKVSPDSKNSKEKTNLTKNLTENTPLFIPKAKTLPPLTQKKISSSHTKKRENTVPNNRPLTFSSQTQNSPYNFSFSIPQLESLNLSKDEMNKIEDQYYSFFLRIWEKYQNSFLTGLNNETRENPLRANNFMHTGGQFYKGLIEYDANGHALIIKVVDENGPEIGGKIFLKTLEGMNHIPNPPKALQNQQKFLLHFSLAVN